MSLAIVDGHVLEPDLTVREADVLVDPAEGTIAEIGDDLAGQAHETLDASEGLVIPGLVNAHCHAAMTLLRGYADDKSLDAWLQEDIWPVEAALTPADIRVGTELGVLEMIKAGTTSFVDMYFEMDQVVDVVERAGVRAVLGHGVIAAGKDHAAAVADAETGLEFARAHDGAADGRIRTAFMPHSLTTVTPELYEAFVPRARRAGLPIHLHANETVAEVEPILEDHGVRPLEYARDLGLLEPEDFLAHGVHLDHAEIELLAETGTGVAHCPASNMKLASGLAPVQAMLEAGVDVAIGTDGAASNNDLSTFDELRDAAMVGKIAAEDAGAVDAGAVVSMATAGGARVTGLADDQPGLGRIEAGAPADLAVIDFAVPHLTPVTDHVSHLAYAVAAADVRHTICDGRVLMADRAVQTLDEAAIRAAASERAEALYERA